MKLIENNAGMFPGETCHVPVCGVCGCKKLFHQETGKMFRLNKCPHCGHILNWNNQRKVKGGSDGK